MEVRKAATFMRAFGDPTRLRILALLTEKECSVATLSRLLECPNARVSRHLRYLHARGVVECRPERNAMVYRLAVPRDRLHHLALTALQQALPEMQEVQRDTARVKKKSTEKG
jgi:ArsR family transcriptional regulator